MVQGDLIRILAALSEEEGKQFGLFVQSPLHNKYLPARQLVSWLEQTRREWWPLYKDWQESPRKDSELFAELNTLIGKKRAFAEIYQEEEYNDPRIRKVISITKGLLEEFIREYLTVRKDEYRFQGEVRLLDFFLNLGEDKLYEKAMKRIRSRVESRELKDSNSYFILAKLAELQLSVVIRSGKKEDTLKEWSDQFDRYFVLTKLRQYAGMKAREQSFDLNYEYPLDEMIAAYIKESPFLHIPLIKIWQQVLRLEVKDEEWNAYSSLSYYLIEYQKAIEGAELRMIYAMMLNFLARENRATKGKYIREIFGLVKAMVESGAIYIEGKINSSYFNSCFRAAMLAKEFEWAENFVYQHEFSLLGPNPQDLVDHSILLILFEREEFSTILKKVDTIQFKDKKKELFRRLLKLRTLYELGHSENFFNLCDALRKYIPAQKMLGKTARNHSLNFVQCAERLGRVRFDLRPLKPQLREDVVALELGEREWLLERWQKSSLVRSRRPYENPRGQKRPDDQEITQASFNPLFPGENPSMGH